MPPKTRPENRPPFTDHGDVLCLLCSRHGQTRHVTVHDVRRPRIVTPKPSRPLGADDPCTTHSIKFAKQCAREFDEQPHPGNASHARAIEQIHGRCFRRLPVFERSYQGAAGEILKIGPIQYPDNSMSRQCKLDHQVAVRIASGLQAVKEPMQSRVSSVTARLTQRSIVGFSDSARLLTCRCLDLP